MIRVVYDRKVHRVTAAGHAGYAPYGSDIICSAVTILIYTLAETAERMVERGVLDDCAVHMDNGNADILCLPSTEQVVTIYTVMDNICVGFELLRNTYPTYVEYEIRK